MANHRVKDHVIASSGINDSRLSHWLQLAVSPLPNVGLLQRLQPIACSLFP